MLLSSYKQWVQPKTSSESLRQALRAIRLASSSMSLSFDRSQFYHHSKASSKLRQFVERQNSPQEAEMFDVCVVVFNLVYADDKSTSTFLYMGISLGRPAAHHTPPRTHGSPPSLCLRTSSNFGSRPYLLRQQAASYCVKPPPTTTLTAAAIVHLNRRAAVYFRSFGIGVGAKDTFEEVKPRYTHACGIHLRSSVIRQA